MRKKFSFLIMTVLMLALLLSGCTKQNPDDTYYNGRLGSELFNELQTDVSFVSYVYDELSLSEQYSLEDYNNPEVQEAINKKCIEAYGVSIPEIAFESIPAWADATEECGGWSYKFITTQRALAPYSVDIAGKTMTCNAVLHCGMRGMEVQMVYNVFDNELTAISFTPQYSLGEKMAKAGINTIISIGVVFAVLILICCLISCFRIFPYLENRKKQKNASEQKAVVSAENSTVATAVSEGCTDDTELVAVIAAAIAASEGCSTSDFVVRSINRR